MYLKQLPNSKRYHDFKTIYQINIDNYDYFKEGKSVYWSEFLERNSHKSRGIKEFTIDINLKYLEEMDYTKNKKGLTTLEKLLYLFICDDERVLDQLYQGDELMENIREDAKKVQEVLDSFLYYNKEELLKNAAIGEGIDRKSREIAKKLIIKKMDIDLICEVTELSKNEVLEIQKEIK